jgi:16S rRNA (guanine966-N2)-methyltransferase
MRSRHRDKTKATGSGSLRIIGGDWRGRKLLFPAIDGLRPTSDRVRETLFNWLGPWLAGATCLDMFSGSGALGLEALSRGAAHCDFIERNDQAAVAIGDHLQRLNAQSRGNVVNADALSVRLSPLKHYDVVFIDPPFAANLFQPALECIVEAGILAANARIYLEQPRLHPLPPAIDHFEILKDKSAGDVRYFLLATRP